MYSMGIIFHYSKEDSLFIHFYLPWDIWGGLQREREISKRKREKRDKEREEREWEKEKEKERGWRREGQGREVVGLLNERKHTSHKRGVEEEEEEAMQENSKYNPTICLPPASLPKPPDVFPFT